MIRRPSIFLFLMSTVILGFLGCCELSLRFSPSFNEFIYAHTTPRNSDDFRIWYRLRRAQSEGRKPSVAFIGTSTTRDGVDVRLFATKFPRLNFFNLGGVYKLPEHEVHFIDDYAAAGIDYLVYWISGSDVFKFRRSGSSVHSDYYPGLEKQAEIFQNPTFEKIILAYPSFWRDLFGDLFLTFRFRVVLAEAFENATLGFLGIQMAGDFDFFWEQQRFDDPNLIAHRLRYIERSESFFSDKLEASFISLEKAAQLTQTYGMQLLLLYSNGVCDDYRKTFPPHVLAAEQELADGLMKIAKSHDHVHFARLTPFPCDQYAELFHLNSAGRHEFFKKTATILEPYLRQIQ